MSDHGGWFKVPGDRIRELREAEAQRDRAVAALREIEEWPGLSIGICRLMKARAYAVLRELEES